LSDIKPQQQEETVNFVSRKEIYGVEVDNQIAMFDDGYTEKSSLGASIERPILAYQYTWDSNAPGIKVFFDPWTAWQTDSFIKSKLQNYAYLRCNLHVKAVPACSNFQWGKLMINYIPFGSQANTSYQAAATTCYGSGATNSKEAVVQHLSTYPITGFINAADNNVVELDLPFIYHRTFLPINGTDVESLDRITLGEISIFPMNELCTMNADVTETATIKFYVWATDVQLAVPTNFIQTSFLGDEFSDCIFEQTSYKKKKYSVTAKGVSEVEDVKAGVISAPATAIANIAGRLTDVPFIGPFAKATEIGADAVSTIAKLFGFSNPSMNVTPVPRSLRLYRNLANIIGQDTSEKLSLDPNQELTIDPRVTGWTGADELVIGNIISREQWLTKGVWAGAVGQFAAPNTTLICAALVNPIQTRVCSAYGVTPTRQAIQNSPAGHIARLFKYWRGKMIFRIEVVASPYHNGTLIIQFEPAVNVNALSKSDFNYADVATRQTIIMDISETKEIEVEIDFVHQRPFLQTRDIIYQTFEPAGIASTSMSLESVYNENNDLGFITVSVLNELTAPGKVFSNPVSKANASVDVNLWCRCDSEMTFGQPVSGWEGDYFDPTSFSASTATGLTEFETVVLNKAEDTKTMNLTCFGERIVSLRSLLKRPTMSQYNVFASGAGLNSQYYVQAFYPHFPPQRTRTVSGRYRLCYESYLSPCFLMKRGGMRHKIYLNNSAPVDGLSTTVAPGSTGMAILSRQASDTTKSVVPTANSSALPGRDTFIAAVSTGSTGQMITDLGYNPSLDVESPFYSSTRFAQANYLRETTDTTLAINPTMQQVLYLVLDIRGPNAKSWQYVVHSSTAEDYNLMCFLAPPMHWLFT